MEDIEDYDESVEEKPTKRKYNMSQEAREARLKNLAKGQQILKEKREKAKAKKKQQIEIQHDDTDESDEDESDEDLEEFIVKKKKAKSKLDKLEKSKPIKGDRTKYLEREINELKKLLKQKPTINKTIVNLPNQNGGQSKDNPAAETIKARLFNMYSK